MIEFNATNKHVFTIACSVYILVLLLYCILDYSYFKNKTMESIDTELHKSAVSLKYIIPDDFHDRAINENAISYKEDEYIANKLTRYIKSTGIKYAYTIVKKEDNLFFIASDIAADPKTKRGTFYYYHYEEADESFIKAFDQKKPTYITVTDQWGSVRTVMVPEKTSGGIEYLACADYDISYVKGVLKKNLLHSIGTVLFFILLSVPIIVIYIKSHRKYIDSLTDGEEKYRSIFENAIEGFYQSSPEGRFIIANPALSNMFGYDSPEEITSSISNIPQQLYVNPEDRFLYQDILLNKGYIEDFEFEAHRKDGSHMWVSSSARAVYDKNGKVSHFEGNLNDITERKLTEIELKKSEKRYRTLFDKSTDAIFIVERKTGRYLDANEAAILLSGRKLIELKQLSTKDVTPDGYNKKLKLINNSDVNQDLGKIVFVHPDGTQRIAMLTTAPIDNEAVIGIARDITDELEMEEHLRQAQKMEAIGTLAGGIAHDFNNILSAILGYSELALMDLSDESSIRYKIEAIHNSGERARDLVAQILTFSRKVEQVRSPVQLHLIIKDALKLLRPAIPATIDIQTEITSKCHLLGDPSRLHQIIMNLCTNAYQAMLENGGTLKISLSHEKMEGKAADFVQIPDGIYGKLTISDTGVGIPAENLKRIFDPYFTTKELGKGTGLGLAAVHGIVKSHGGVILVESLIKKGTTFEVYLPLTAENNITIEEDDSPIVGGKERILLVDDEGDILEIESEMLKKQGYTVTSKDDAREALKLFSERPDQFDLVVTDMSMPKISGSNLAVELTNIRSDIPIIICTGFSEQMSQEKAKELGIKGFLMKPVLMKDLLNLIRNVLD